MGGGLPSPLASCCHSPNVASSRDGMDNETSTESMVSHRRERARRRNREEGKRLHPRSLLTLSSCPSLGGVSGESSQDLGDPHSPAALPDPRSTGA